MRLLEFMDQPYKLDYRGEVSFIRKTATTNRTKERKGVSGSFITDAGNEYKLVGYNIGLTKPERDQRKKDIEDEDEFTPFFLDWDRGGIWEVHFSLATEDEEGNKKRESGVTGTGDAFRVLATVGHFIKILISEKAPEIISIKSISGQAHRGKLYLRMMKRFASDSGYRVGKVVDTGKLQRITLHRIPKVFKEAGVGIITDYNTTADVKPGETTRQANKFNLDLDKNGHPKILGSKYNGVKKSKK